MCNYAKYELEFQGFTTVGNSLQIKVPLGLNFVFCLARVCAKKGQ